MNLLESVPPKVSSPLVTVSWVVGSKETATTSVEIVPWLKRLSVTVGMLLLPLTVPWVRSTVPIPRIPSTPEKPDERDATPMDWLGMTRLPRVTWSVHSVPEKEPEP